MHLENDFAAAHILAAAALAAAAPAMAQDGGLADPAAIDAEIAAFTGAAAGAPGGARQPVDRRFRLAACPVPLRIEWYGRASDMVRVECTSGTGWRIYVPVTATSGPAAAPGGAPLPIVVQRGQMLTITVEGRGFAVSQQGEALEDGAIGAWIRIRPEGNREPVRARIQSPQRAVIPLE